MDENMSLHSLQGLPGIESDVWGAFCPKWGDLRALTLARLIVAIVRSIVDSPA